MCLSPKKYVEQSLIKDWHHPQKSVYGALSSCCTQPPTVVCKVEAQLEYTRIACTFFACLALTCMLSQCLLNKISASELSRKFIRDALLVGQVFSTPSLFLVLPPPPSDDDCWPGQWMWLEDPSRVGTESKVFRAAPGGRLVPEDWSRR